MVDNGLKRVSEENVPVLIHHAIIEPIEGVPKIAVENRFHLTSGWIENYKT